MLYTYKQPSGSFLYSYHRLQIHCCLSAFFSRRRASFCCTGDIFEIGRHETAIVVPRLGSVSFRPKGSRDEDHHQHHINRSNTNNNMNSASTPTTGHNNNNNNNQDNDKDNDDDNNSDTGEIKTKDGML